MASGTKILYLFNNPVKDYVGRIAAGGSRPGTHAGFTVAVENTFDTGRQIGDILKDDGLAGIVLTPPFSDDRHTLLAIEGRGLPYVRIAPLLDPDRGSSVIMDEYEAARSIVDHLLNKGHRRIGIMRGPSSHLVSMRRYNGYANALGGKGLRVDQALVAQGDFSRDSGKREAGKLFAAKPTAIFASNDDMAAGIIDAAAAAGIRMPETISIVGYDDNAIAKTIRPRLTTIRQPLEKMGETATELMVERIRQPSKGNRHLTVPFELIERESVVECAAAAPPA